MKTIIAIVVLSASVGVTAYHVTENGKAPPEQAMTEIQSSSSPAETAWSPTRFSAPVPLNIVAPAPVTAGPARRDMFPSVVVMQTSRLQRSINPESEKPCRALKPPRSPDPVAVDLPSEDASHSLAAIPVSAERVVAPRSGGDMVASASAPSSAMPMRRVCCPPRRKPGGPSNAVERHLRPGTAWKP